MNISRQQKQAIGFQYIIDRLMPLTPYGNLALRNMNAYAPGEHQKLNKELENIEKTRTAILQYPELISALKETITPIKNIKASIEKIGTTLTEVDLFEIKRYLIRLQQIKKAYDALNSQAEFYDIHFDDTTDTLKILDPDNTLIPVFHFSAKTFPNLQKIRDEKLSIESKIRNTDSTDDVLNELKAQRSVLAAQEQTEEKQAAIILSKALIPYKTALQSSTSAIASIDLMILKATLALEYCATKPQIDATQITLTDMINPMLDDALKGSGMRFTPISIDCSLGTTVITGANMGGKSVALKTLALNVLLIHYGFFPFAKNVHCPLLDEIYPVSCDLEDANRGLSSFAGEVVMLQEILDNIQNKTALILLDEFARGTNPSEGEVLAKAVCSYLNKRNAYTVMTTHFDGVSSEASTHYQVVGLSKMVLNDELISKFRELSISQRVRAIGAEMDYGLVKVNPSKALPKDAINIAGLLGLDEEIIGLPLSEQP